MTTNHKYYLNLAFEIAKINLGKTKFNPAVGAVIVKNNSVISSGVTSINGRPHAEFNALNKKKNFKDATLYTTLEPCTHFGETPPCVNIIKDNITNIITRLFNAAIGLSLSAAALASLIDLSLTANCCIINF